LQLFDIAKFDQHKVSNFGVNDKILAELQAAAAHSMIPPQRNKVFLTFAGSVNSSSLRWMANASARKRSQNGKVAPQ
jgi:hypothetical protein